ncbi:hypothetical protein CLV92_102293 [Kineococcus xinjiangensis]|uniref:Uncharacterized protein n=1 Tax=Kineococcus xinjiangensis TaxID=512762 RepID=A0A2S6IV37_9ACTN|nr:hypothetical protein CLV92_102293 [Kineococcus xinjiangensis]
MTGEQREDRHRFPVQPPASVEARTPLEWP